MNPFTELRYCFKNEIIPLLQEYFFGDYEKIALVLGEDFVTKSEYKSDVFAKFKGANGSDFLKPTYSINNDTLNTDDKFKNGLSKLLGIKEPQMTFSSEQM
ncbi:MAG: hypothetical protein EOO47_20170 [Flavobacterium sp.]|nr:MAG: hypothetical protein EOO47_20170 [Flavobacterium sp.]